MIDFLKLFVGSIVGLFRSHAAREELAGVVAPSAFIMPSAKDVEVPGMRIAMQRFLNLQGKTVHSAPHVRRTGRQPNANPGRRNNHRRSTVITRRSVTKPTLCPTLIDVPSGSVISTLSSGACSVPLIDDGSICSAPSPFAGSPIVCTGKRTCGASGLSTPRRTWLRQFHNSPRLISYLRAISAMRKRHGGGRSLVI